MGAERGVRSAAELRRAFDASFALAPASETGTQVDLLAIRVGAAPYAVRLTDAAGLLVDRPVTPLPGRLAELLGLAGLRGTLVPVYDLRILLGQAAGGMPRWLVVTAGRHPIGLAFDGFDGHLRVDAEQMAVGVRPILDLQALITDIERRAARGPRAGSSEP